MQTFKSKFGIQTVRPYSARTSTLTNDVSVYFLFVVDVPSFLDRSKAEVSPIHTTIERERESHVEDWIVTLLAVYALFCVPKESVVQRIAVSDCCVFVFVVVLFPSGHFPSIGIVT
jgi:hypothetical protein